MAEDSSTRTTRLSGEMDRQYEEFRDGHDMTDAEALRTLIREGLNDDEPTRSATDNDLLRLAEQLGIFAFVLGVSAVIGLAPAAAYTAGVVMVGAAVPLMVEVRYRPLRRLVAALRTIDTNETPGAEVRE